MQFVDKRLRWIVGGTQLLSIKVWSYSPADVTGSLCLVAIDRVHRLGQEKTVYVKHFIVSLHILKIMCRFQNVLQVEDTIEGRILDIQRRKTAIVKEAFRGTQKSGKGDSESIDNLKVIFGDT